MKNKLPEKRLILLLTFIAAAGGIFLLLSNSRINNLISSAVMLAALAFLSVIIFLVIFKKAVQKQNSILMKEIEDKDIFIREIHNRVKYNFNIMSTLINIQNEQVKTIDDAHRALSDLNGRISSMSLIHDQLYDAEDLSRIDMNAYFSQLRQQLKNQFPNDELPSVLIEADSVYLGINSAVPCGLLINEIMYLCLSYAKSPDKILDVVIRMNEEEAGRYRLLITDTGLDMRAWPASPEIEFSIMLIHQLSGKLNADIAISYDNGNIFRIDF